MTWTILHNCLQMIYFRVLGRLVFHLFFKKKKKSLSLWYRFSRKKKYFGDFNSIVFNPFILISLQVRQMCQIECYSTVICNFFSTTVKRASGRYDDSILRQNYANFRDLENEAENANRSRVIICQHNGNTNETV